MASKWNFFFGIFVGFVCFAIWNTVRVTKKIKLEFRDKENKVS